MECIHGKNVKVNCEIGKITVKSWLIYSKRKQCVLYVFTWDVIHYKNNNKRLVMH